MIGRRTLLLLAVLPVRCADRNEVLDLFAQVASGLSDGNAALALRPFDKKRMADYDRLRELIEALIAQAEMTLSVKLVNLEADEAELDWDMQIKSREAAGAFEQRREPVLATISRGRIIDFSPLELFAPLKTAAPPKP